MACSWPSPSVRLNRHGLGWQGTRPSSRITERTSSGPAGTPQAARSAWTRRYPYVPSESSNDFRAAGYYPAPFRRRQFGHIHSP